jgi:hypothetical protein
VDADNTAWIADTNVGLYRVDASGPKMVYKATLPIAADPGQTTPNVLGVAIDFDLFPWVVSFGNSKTYKVDPKTNQFLGAVAVGTNPYMYSDFSGFALRNAGTALGVWRHQFPGCGTQTQWADLSWKISNAAATHVFISVRSAHTAAGLASAQFHEIATVPSATSPVPIKLPAGAPTEFLEVEFDLFSSVPTSTPILSGISVGYNCTILG